MTRLTNWQSVKLKSVCDEITVGHVGPMANEYVEEGIPFLRSQNIQPFRINRDDIKFIPPEFHSRLRKSSLRPGNVAVVRTGYPGTACVIPSDLPISNCADLVIIRPSSKINPHYLAAVFNSTWGRGLVAGNLVGVAQQHFNIGAAKELTIDLPPIRVQDAITAILCSYTNLIENNTRRITILESMAQAQYRKWFSSPALNKTPRVTGELARNQKLEIGDGYRAKNSELSSTGLPFLRAQNIINNGFLVEGADLLCPASVEKAGDKLSKPGDVVMTSKGTVGRFAFVTSHTPKFVYAPQLCYWRSVDKQAIHPLFLLYWMQSKDFLDQVSKVKGLTDMADYVSLSDQRRMTISLPSPTDQAWFIHQVEPIQSLIENCQRRVANLQTTRDLLLPRLISGQIDVEHLEIDAGETLAVSGGTLP